MTCKTCGAPTGWVRGVDLERANESKRAAMADAVALRCQVDSLRAALVKLLAAREKEAKATMSYQNARENFSDSANERNANVRAMLAASRAEREARLLLATLKTPNVPHEPQAPVPR